MITGDEILVARKTLQWSRSQLADALGMTVSQIARCEMKGPKDHEAPNFEELLQKAGVRTVNDRPESPIASDLLPQPEGRVTRWRGLGRGSVIKIRGGVHNSERMRFGYFQSSPAGDYVGCFNLRNGGEHAIPAEYVRDQRGKPLPEEVLL